MCRKRWPALANEPPAQRAVLQGVLFSRWDQPVTRATDARIDSAGRWVR